MARVFFQCARRGYRKVRGAEILRIQWALKNAGLDPGMTDEVYGHGTTVALQMFQQSQGLDVTGAVTEETYLLLTGRPIPSLPARCLQVTSDIEGHGFRKASGNWDHAGLTWGIIGFTVKSGEVPKILERIMKAHPAVFHKAFGQKADEMRRVLEQTREEQLRWADGISVGNRHRLHEAWEKAFSDLGAFEEVQAVQMERVGKYWDRAVKDAARFGLRSELGRALCFDIAVQNGGIDHKNEERRICDWMADHPAAPESELRPAIADIVAENSRPQFIEDVRARKRLFATGQGQVHGARYALQDWGLDETHA